jgi:hypothetical protein
MRLLLRNLDDDIYAACSPVFLAFPEVYVSSENVSPPVHLNVKKMTSMTNNCFCARSFGVVFGVRAKFKLECVGAMIESFFDAGNRN